MEHSSPHHDTAPAVDFAAFNFENLTWEPAPPQGDAECFVATVPLTIDGARFDLRLSKDVLTMPEATTVTLLFSLYSKDTGDTKLLSGSIDIVVDQNEVNTMTVMNPRDRSEVLRKGAGREMVEKMIVYIGEALPREYKKPVIHKIIFGSFGPMNFESWFKVYGPLIEKYKYTPILPDEHIWERTYQP